MTTTEMMQGTGQAAETDPREALVGRLFESVIAAGELYTLYLGEQLGLYRALADGEWKTSATLAGSTGIAERYAREWLEQQAASAYVETKGTADGGRLFRLDPRAAEVLLDKDSPFYFGVAGRVAHGLAQALPRLVEAYRSGGGIPWSEYGAGISEIQGDFNRATFLNSLGQEWLPSIVDLDARLQADPPARIADIGCGTGWSSIAMATAYPKTRVDGFDLDDTAIMIARANGEDRGVAARVSFEVRDAADPANVGQYDLVTAFEMIHDLSQPVAVLRAARAMLKPGGSMLIMDERVAEEFAAPADPVERLMYLSSALLCLPNSMAEPPSAATGTVMRPATLRRYAAEAGFSATEIVPVEHPFFRFYRLTP